MKRIKKITRHTFKYFIIPVSVIMCILAGTGTSFFYFFPKTKILSMVTETAEKTIKRKVDAKDIHYSLRGASLTKVTILSSMNPTDPPLLDIGTIDIRFNLFSLLHNKLEITGLVISDININISYEKEQWNLKNLADDILSGADKKNESGTSASIKYISFENAAVYLQSTPVSLKPLIGKYLFNGSIEFTNKETLTLTDFSLILPEGRGSVEGKSASVFPLTKNFTVKGAVKAHNISLGWIYRWVPDIVLPFTEISGTFSDLTVSASKAEGYFSGSSYLRNKTSLIAEGKFNIQFQPLFAAITDVSGKILQSSLRLKSLYIARGRTPAFSADSIDGNLEEILPVIPYAPALLYGKVKGNISSDGTLFNGKLNLADAGFNREKNILSGVTGDVTVVNNTARIEKLPLKLLGQNATVSAAAPDSFFKEIILNINMNSFTFPSDEKQPAKNQSGTGSSAAAGTLIIPDLPMKIRGTAEVGVMTKGIYTVKNIEANYNYSAKKISIPRFRFAFLDSSIIGTGSVDLTGSSPVVDTKLTTDDLKIQRLGEIKKDLIGRFFGIAKTRISLSFSPTNPDGGIESAKGNLDFSINNGKVANTGIQNALGVWLDPLKYKLKDIEFNTISGSLTISNGDLIIRSLIFNSPDIRVMFDGTLESLNNLNTKMVLEFNDSFIQDIPNPARIIALSNIKKGKWYTIYRSIKGDIEKGNYDVVEIK